MKCGNFNQLCQLSEMTCIFCYNQIIIAWVDLRRCSSLSSLRYCNNVKLKGGKTSASLIRELTHERLFSVMVGRHFTNRSGKLRNLYFSFVVTLEAGEHDLPLTGLEAVDNAWDRTLVVQVREEDQFFVDEVL